jgi:antitoxin component YwqK of YwqJK toxin-antitoxin module
MKHYFLILFCIYFLFGCNPNDINDKRKRNEHWAWWKDAKTGKEKWLKITEDSSTVEKGKFTLFYFNGNIREIGKIDNRKNVDTIFKYNLEGKLVEYCVLPNSEWYFINDGFIKLHYPDGKLSAEGIILNHTFGDKWKKYFTNGNLDYTRNFVKDTGWIINYYESGLRKDSIYHVKGLGDFTIVSWYENGQTKESNTFKGNDFNGITKHYYENGQLKDSSMLVNGKREGIGLMWYETGELNAKNNLKNGKFDGQAYTYHKNGKIKTYANAKNGVLNGEVKQFDENGKLISDDFYKDGVIVNKLP